MKRISIKMIIALVATVLLCLGTTLTVSASEGGAAEAAVEAVGDVTDNAAEEAVETAEEETDEIAPEMTGEDEEGEDAATAEEGEAEVEEEAPVVD